MALLAMICAGCTKNDSAIVDTTTTSFSQYFFTITYHELGGPQGLRLDTTFLAANPGIFNTPKTPPYQQTLIASYPFFSSNVADSIQFYMSVSWPLQKKIYTDTPYVADSVTLSLLSTSHKLIGAQYPEGALSITDFTDSTAKGDFNFSTIVRGSLVDTLFINGSFNLPHN